MLGVKGSHMEINIQLIEDCKGVSGSNTFLAINFILHVWGFNLREICESKTSKKLDETRFYKVALDLKYNLL